LIVGIGALAAGALGTSPRLAPLLPAVLVGLLLGAVDVRCRRLPNPLVAALAAVTVLPIGLFLLFIGDYGRAGRGASVAVLCFVAYGIMGVGMGDAKLAATLGFVLGVAGWPAVAIGVIAAHMINGVIAIGQLVTGRATRKSTLPFGPALLAGALIAVIV
jgi:leader peptidase (prepilin peptidase) / N-methyltransferase